MRFYMNILTTYFPDRDPPYDVYYQQILEQVQLAEELVQPRARHAQGPAHRQAPDRMGGGT